MCASFNGIYIIDTECIDFTAGPALALDLIHDVLIPHLDPVDHQAFVKEYQKQKRSLYGSGPKHEFHTTFREFGNSKTAFTFPMHRILGTV